MILGVGLIADLGLILISTGVAVMARIRLDVIRGSSEDSTENPADEKKPWAPLIVPSTRSEDASSSFDLDTVFWLRSACCPESPWETTSAVSTAGWSWC